MISFSFSRAALGALMVLVVSGSLYNGTAMATAGWTHFVQQQCDPSNPNAHGGLSGMLSASQQQQLASLDDAVSSVEDQLSQSISASQVTAEKVTEIRQLLGTIQQKQTDVLTKGQLDYETAEGLLLDLQRLKANLNAAKEGRAKPTESDFFNSKDAFEYRDHLLRKLYANRMNNTLSVGEYDELRSHVEHVGQRLDRQGASGSDPKLLKRMREIEGDINRVIHGGEDSPPPDKKNKKKKAVPGRS